MSDGSESNRTEEGRGMNGTETEGFEPEGELDLGIPSQTRTARPLSLVVFLAALPAKWRAEAAATWNGDGVCPDGYIDGIQRRRTAGTLLACAEELDAALAGLGAGTP